MAHDFKKFPELTNNQMQLYYFESPHKQILEDFNAQVVKVIDGDTIRVKTNFRDFDFPIRVSKINAPELDEIGGLASKRWLEGLIQNREVEILIDVKNRVDVFGRLLGDILIDGDLVSEAALRENRAIVFGTIKDGSIPQLEELL